MKPPSQSLLRESVREMLLYLIALIIAPFRIITLFVPVTRAAKAWLRTLTTKPFLEGEGRKSYENREWFPRYSRRIHAIFTPSPPHEQGDRRAFVHSGLSGHSQRYKSVLIIILSTLALVITLCGCGKWNARNPMVPISPTLTVGSVFSLPGQVQAMAAKGSLLYICLMPFSPDSSMNLFYVVDASDPANPQVVGKALDFAHYDDVYGLALYGSYAYVDTYLKGLVVLDISNSAAPKVLASYDTLATIPAGISGSHLYAVGYGLDYLSLSDPVHPKREGRLINAYVSNLLVPWDETRCAFVSFLTHQFMMADFTSPTSPRIVAYSSSPADTYGITYCGGSLFNVTGNSSPAILRYTWEGSDSIYLTSKANLPGSPSCLATLGNRIIVGKSPGFNPNLYLLSATGPQSPYVVGECRLPFRPNHLTADGNRIYTDLGRGQLVAIEVIEH